jgi:single-strand DNA-binding protein
MEVTVPRSVRGGETVPVAWANPPNNAAQLAPGTEVLVLGRVRRRFFRAGGFTQSRTEVVAEKVVPFKRGKKVDNVLNLACERIFEEEERP